mgnify:CR=1 FL=1
MADSTCTAPGRPLLLCGMHRSGTSLTASLLHAAGVRLGDRLLGANLGNDRGHFEDLDIYEFHQTVLRSNGLGTEGYVAAGRVTEPLAPIGRRLAAERARGGGVWGWKEPRTVLFLDYWDAVLPDARYVFVFRRPWEVVDSLFRRGDETFAGNPAFAAEVWLYYNRTIVDFVRRHPDRCLVFEVDRVAADPAGVFAAVRSQLGLEITDPPDLFDSRLLVADGDPGHALAMRACLPEAENVYRELRGLAGALPPPRADASSGDVTALGRRLLMEWRRMRRAESQAAALLPQLTGAREAVAHAEAAAATLRERAADLESENHRLEADRLQQAEQIAVLQAEIDGAHVQQAERLAALQAAIDGVLVQQAEQRAALETALAPLPGLTTAVRGLERAIAALRQDVHDRDEVLAWTAARLRARQGSVLGRVGREFRRLGRQIAAAARRLWHRAEPAAGSVQADDHRDAA